MKKITLVLSLFIMSFAYGQPGSPAPTPTKASIDVISVYSDTYTSIATNIDPFWGQGTDATDIQISGNQTLSYSGLDYQGLDYTSSDVSAMEYLHIDYYTDDATALQFYLISPALENAYDIAVEDGITTGQWVSIDIPLTHYTVPNLTQVAQFKTVGNGTVYFDNLYFWKAPAAAGTDTSLSDLTVNNTTISGFSSLGSTYSIELPSGTTVVPTVVATTTDSNASNIVSPAASLPGATTILVTAQNGSTTNTITINFTLDPTPATSAPAPTKASIDVISIYSDTYTSIVTDLNPSWGQATTMSEIEIAANNTLKYANLNYQGMVYTNSNVSAMEYVHLDYYTSDATDLNFSVISPGQENSYDIDGLVGITTGSWVGVDIPLSHYTVPDLTDVFQFKTEGNGTVFIDNIYFWKTAVDPLTDATLTDIKVDSETITDFSAAVISYDVILPKGTTNVPQITLATKSHNGATAVITQAPQLPGDATIVVTSEDGNTTKTYTISFSVNNNSACEGTSSDATEGSYSVGYDYHFETLETGATDVKVTFTLIDEDKVGYVPQVFIAPSTFINMNADGSTYSATLTDQTGTISFSIRGAHSTGVVTSQLFEYTVGDTCDALSTQKFEIEGLEIYPNPTSTIWNFNTKNHNIKSIEIIDVTGKIVFTTTPNTLSTVIDGSNFPAGMYITRITTEKGTQSKTLIRK